MSAAPLDGVRVVDLSTVFAVPYMGGLLRDLGADVVKVEAPQRLDQTRSGAFGPLFDNVVDEDPWNRSGTFQSLNRGKRSLVLDLKQDQGRAVLRRLVATADVLVDNFTPRVMRSWELTYDDLRPLNPRLVMLSNTGYGSSGPWAPFRAQGTTLEATMGITHYNGYAGRRPGKVGQSYPDFVAAWTGLTLLMAALVRARRTGRGQWIDLGMYQLGPAVAVEGLLQVQAGEPDVARMGSADLDALVSGLFPAAGQDRWLAVSVADRTALVALASVVPGIDPPAAGQPVDQAAVCRAVAGWSAAREATEAAADLQAAGVAAGPVLDARELLLDPQLGHRGFYEDADFGAAVGERPLIGRPFRWRGGADDVAVRGRGPLFGEHNDEVLAEAGYPAEEVAALREHGVVADHPLGRPQPQPLDLDLMLVSGTYRSIDPDYVELLASRPRPAAEG